MNEAKTLILRTCDAQLRGHGGFQWPESGPVEYTDWSPVAKCGNGLHGLLEGKGGGGLLNWNEDAKWLVVEVDRSTLVTLDNGEKVKFPRGSVVYCGQMRGAIDFLIAAGIDSTGMIGAVVTAGYSGTATAGYSGTATAGDRGTATAGYSGTARGGLDATLIIKWYDQANNRIRCKIAIVGENGIEPNVWYRLDDKHRFVKVEE